MNEYRTGPLYFFDQPTKRNRIKGARSNILHLSSSREGAQSEDATQRGANERAGGALDGPPRGLSGDSRRDVEPETSSPVGAAAPNTMDRDSLGAYKRAAPRLLEEVALLLSTHKGSEEGHLPRGLVNILNDSWGDRTSGPTRWRSPQLADRCSGELDESPSRQVSATDQRGAGGRNSWVVGKAGPAERKPQSCSDAGMKMGKATFGAQSSIVTFPGSSNSCSHPGWIIQPQQPSCGGPQPVRLCQWVLERLQAARSAEKPPTAIRHLSKPLTLRHYGDAKAKLKDKRARITSKPAALVDGMPLIPEVKQQDPELQKLHYAMEDGSSFIYYPSGRIAVCQSRSALPRGGFYTNVFTDGQRPVFLASVTASGRGAVTHRLSSAITAVWDQAGGFICDHSGNITKEWSWQTERKPREKIVIQLSEMISVRLLSGTSAVLNFRCNNESVELHLWSLSNINQPQETGVRRVEELEEPSARWRRREHVGRELKRLQQRARNTVDSWLDYYHVAIGIRCPDKQRISDAPLKTSRRREVRSAALPSLKPPKRADAKPVPPEEDRSALRELPGHRSVPADEPPDSYVKLPRTSKKQPKEEPHVTRIGPLQFHGNINLESVIIPKRADLHASAVIRCPAPPSLPPSTSLTVCPALLRAALLGEGGRRRCCCSATLMPVVTDLEYDAFVLGQPPHSQQILVVCAALPLRPVSSRVVSESDPLELLYRRKNKHRTMPCSQCQMDSFRLVRYEMSSGQPGCGAENLLLQQRHNAAAGMFLVSEPTAGLTGGCRLSPVQVFWAPTGGQQRRSPLAEAGTAIVTERKTVMYMRGTLLFMGHIFSDYSCFARDLQKQISRSRGDYRLGLGFSSDCKYSDPVPHNSQDSTLKGGNDRTPTASAARKNDRK
ncbi:uncharacterized protein C3orf20-like isoform 2-T2 [Spinachia spinachia]